MHQSIKLISLLFIPPLLLSYPSMGYHDEAKKINRSNRKLVNSRKLSSKAVEVADLSVQISGKSGSVSISRAKMGKKKDKDSKVKITMTELRELDADGNLVGEKGKEKHSLKSFAQTDFTFSAEEANITMTTPNDGVNATDNSTGVTDPTETTGEGVNITFSATLDTGSELDVYTYFFSQPGEVGTISEKWAVQPGDMKFNIGLRNWAWCDPCTDGTGAFVELDIEIKGKKAKPEKKGTEKKWDLGDGATLDLSDQLMVDGNWTMMSEGYPKLVMKGSKQVYTFRFPKFSENAFYDPVVTFDPDAADLDDGSDADDLDDSSSDDGSPPTSTSVATSVVMTGIAASVTGLLTLFLIG